MSAEDQSINFTYGFQLRGERQVERGLDGIIEKFARTGSFADLAGASLEKFGRIFEVGLPLALGAAAIGLATEKVYEAGEEALRTRRKIESITSEPLGDMDSSELESHLSQLGDEIEETGTASGKRYGQGFAEAMTEGINKYSWDAFAFMQNNVGDPIAHLITGRQSVAEKSYEDIHYSDPLQNNAREAFSGLITQDANKMQRLQRSADYSDDHSDSSAPTFQSKARDLEDKANETHQNFDQSKETQASAESGLRDFQDSIKDGHALSKEELQRGVSLEKRLNEARRQALEDQITNNEAQKAFGTYLREASEFKKGEIIASHGRSIGGGGGIFSGAPTMGATAHFSGLGGTANMSLGGGAGMGGSDSLKTIDYLTKFGHAAREATDGLQGVSIKNLSSSTGTF